MIVRSLSKSKCLSGLQCHKKLFLEQFRRDLLPEIDASQQALFDTGTRVGEIARDRFSGGVLVAEDYRHQRQAVERTETLLADPEVHAIYEAGFTFDKINIRADILLRQANNEFDLVEVKSSTKTKDVHEPDLAIQRHVLQACGLKIRRTFLMHLDNAYVFQGGDYDLEQLFTLSDLTDLVRSQSTDVSLELNRMRTMLGQGVEPIIDIGPQCHDPYDCPFLHYCDDGGTEFPVSEFPRIQQRLKDQFAAAGIEDIRSIPEDFAGLSDLHQRVRQSVVTGDSFVDPAISAELSAAEFPVHFMDFETFMPALPLYVGTRPYQTIPFQWSVHTLDEQGVLGHREFLHEGTDDPRRAFAESLLEVLGQQGSIVVYSPYESRIIRETAQALPNLSEDLDQLQERLFDLLPAVRTHVYHPEFHGSFSIKAVLPALVPTLSYDGLEIADGTSASVAFAEMLGTDTTESRRTELRSACLEYCKLDTLAMVELFKTLR